MGKKLTKSIEGTVVTITEGKTEQALNFDFASLPKEIQAKLGPFGLGHKLGDAAAGKEGQEAVDAINKVFEGLKAGDWSIKAPAGERFNVRDLVELYKGTAGKDKTVARGLMEKLGATFDEAGNFVGMKKKEEKAPTAEPKAEAKK